MTFLNSNALFLFITIPFLIIFFIWRNQHRSRMIKHIGEPNLVKPLSNRSVLKVNTKLFLWMCTLVSLILALANPAWGIDESIIEVNGISILVVLDVSDSMNAQDLMPNRLEQAKLAARTLFEAQQDNLVGLILFAGTAFVQFPLTTDWTSAITFLNAATTDSISQQGTALEDALRLALDTLDSRIANRGIIVVMTDGESHEGEPTLAAEEAVAQGVIIHTIGYGSLEGAPIPIIDSSGTVTGYKSDSANNLVLSRLNEDVLKEVAQITGGTYQHASASGIEIVNLLQEISNIESVSLEAQRTPQLIKRFEIFVLFAFICLSIEILLPETKNNA